MQRKVYLVTRRASYNFGSSLQAYALQTLLMQKCGNCEILDVKEMRLRGRVRLTVLDAAGLVLQALPALRRWMGVARYDRLVQSRRARRRFDAFNDGVLVVSPRRLHSERRLRRYVEEGSLIVCGSDQIWNPLGFSPVMFLSFADPVRHTLAAYAPSFGLGEVTLHREEIARLVRRFYYLSAREESGRRTLEELTGRSVPLVLDPTLVVDPSVWPALERAVDVPEDGYVLCYFLSTSLYPLRFIADLAARRGLTVVNIQTNYSPFAMPGAANRADCGPREFLYLVRHAACVCTNSFHCCIFAHLFGRDFYVFDRFAAGDKANQNTRIETLLSILGERHRWVDMEGKSIQQAMPTVSTESQQRAQSLAYLETVCEKELRV